MKREKISCQSIYVFYSKRVEPLEKLHEACCAACCQNQKDEGFSRTPLNWLDILLAEHGFDCDLKKSGGTLTGIQDICRNKDYHYFVLSQENEPCPQSALFEIVLAFPEYAGICLVYEAEDPGNHLFVNSDVDGLFFPERYYCEIVDDCDGDRVIESDYFKDETALAEYIKKNQGWKAVVHCLVSEEKDLHIPEN